MKTLSILCILFIFLFAATASGAVDEFKLTSSDGAAGDIFGISVSISGETAVVGAKNVDIGGKVEQGAAYVFVRSGGVWTQQQKLTASDGAVNDLIC